MHVISDIHGDYKKLRHVINNASGSLRALIEQLFADKITVEERRELLAVLYYPQEALEEIDSKLTDTTERREWVKYTLRRQFEIVRALACTYRRADVVNRFPPAQHELFDELLNESCLHRSASYIDALLTPASAGGPATVSRRRARRAYLSIAELIVAVICDASLDRPVVDYLSRSKVRFVGQPRRVVDGRVSGTRSFDRHGLAALVALSPFVATRRRLRHHARSARTPRARCLQGRPGGTLPHEGHGLT